jgi:hypothetical protein
VRVAAAASFSWPPPPFDVCPSASCVLRVFLFPSLTGAAVAKYAGQHVHERLLKDEAYKNAQYSQALTHAFHGVDADMKEGALLGRALVI